ncbi:hypothetical protein TVAG_444000 [Trichomonas vaginalis G3]|uniref:BTB domain-containing protein n=1 Tax=Trichomonas vaginalis (strain ATCC PRA-98 / G3) TaxID=412133 RepID=A2E2E2_TRIV3|nr:ankyrin repeat domain-containing protein 61 family [Trichomonas vaginalis G3]EAY13117.1 hypothetical protein TVAG_444000 [Trichomonas vaginalis G3]KAI5528218.1 ankyrin repeat domain-containing protein 61 family [Trichomonas vaginalis G3]|eukprot:XP_001325340.1 hypothetical protein [Trichomonas vaginalis G3]
MPIIQWKQAFENLAKQNKNCNRSVTVFINNNEFTSTIFFLSAISNKVENSLYLDDNPDNFSFNCCIKDQKTYEILGELFNGKLMNKDLSDSIIIDLFEFAIAIECPDLIEFYHESFELSKYSLDNFTKNVIYFKYYDVKDEFITFVSQNINNIGITNLVTI